MSIAYEQFLDRLIPHVPGCTDPVAVQALRDATIEFCVRSDWLTFEHDPITLLAGTSTYELEPPEDHIVSHVIQARLDGAALTPITLDDLGRRYDDWRDVEGPPTHYTHLTPGEIVLFPRPTERMTSALKLVVSLRPSQDSDEVEDSIYEWWCETIIDGALWRLMELPGQPFSNPQMAEVKARRFRSGIGLAHARRHQSHTREPQRIQMRSFF